MRSYASNEQHRAPLMNSLVTTRAASAQAASKEATEALCVLCMQALDSALSSCDQIQAEIQVDLQAYEVSTP